MSDTITEAVSALNAKMDGQDIGGTVKFDIEGEGTIIMDDNGARAADEDADVTMTADADTFREILEGEMNPTAAFMSGKLSIDGDMGLAMKLAGVLS
ncbi:MULTISPECIES: SCP2 sterol-binding domain-containing protein [unclassified Roseivivax]|uniref:SCP2 sterol-binding domain-containing protein n=1 Tax=Roseivivax sp. GX 12232 TaxID=2900547 RepID=UPI001E575FFF|nr:SCP2 sterol-binding domain-containing protein [Roseivivax sp. GX 12232]MCE0503767.1 SCP2 sterol-binding domain-containing protein [Roseivivax sp. GX 12232]